MPFINQSEATKRSKDRKVHMARTVGAVFSLSTSFKYNPLFIIKGCILSIHTHTFAIHHLRHLEFRLPQSLSLSQDFGSPKSWIQDFDSPKSWIQDSGRPSKILKILAFENLNSGSVGSPKSWIQDCATLTPRYNSRKITLTVAVPQRNCSKTIDKSLPLIKPTINFPRVKYLALRNL